jgi:arylsulfatase A-like enzyme
MSYHVRKSPRFNQSPGIPGKANFCGGKMGIDIIHDPDTTGKDQTNHFMRPFLSPSLFALFLLFGYGLSSLQADEYAPRKKPNILFLMADDLNNALGCYGHPLVKSPNIDALAKRGVRFERSYCQFPLCGPSRNSLLTGRYPNSTGILGNSLIFRQTIPQAISLPQAFRLEGWFAGRIGKLYHYNVPKSVGTNGHDDPASWELELNPAGCDRLEEEGEIFSLVRGQFGGTLSWYASPRPEAKHTDALLAKDAEWVLERCAREKDRPFFLAVGFYRPHTPYVAPASYFEGYPVKEMPLVKDVEADQADIPAMGLASRKNEQSKLTDDLRQQAIQAYFSSITFMDNQVGKILQALEKLGLAENTIVVFTSDHGYHLGEHGLWQKQSLFEESSRIPLIMAGPGIPQGQVNGAPVGLIDIYPTLVDMAEIKPPEGLQGQSLLPMIKDSAEEGRGFALSQVMRGQRNGTPIMGWSIRTRQWRYTEWDEGKQGKELYDHETDPKEITNLAQDEAHAKIVADLSQKLQEATAKTLPRNGKIPPVMENTWAPNLTNP